MTPQSFQAHQDGQFFVRNVQTPQLLVHPVQLYDHFIRYHA